MNDSILVIDDQQASLQQIVSTFKHAAIKYHIEANGDIACDLLQGPPQTSLIVMRFASDHVDGLKICRCIRSIPEHDSIRILMIVSEDRAAQTIEALDAGADDIILAPFSGSELLTRCRRLETGPEESAPLSQVARINARDSSLQNAAPEAEINDQVHQAGSSETGPATANPNDSGPCDQTAEQQLEEKTLIQPFFDQQTQRFVYPAESVDSIDTWNSDPNVTRIMLDTILTCPECAAVPGFRFGCGECGGGSIEQEMLIHHFACACVAGEREFRTNRNFICPKCRIGGLVAGTDFETTPGCYCCADCFASVDQPELIGHCLQCSLRFPAHEATVMELIAYQLPVRQPAQHSPHVAITRKSNHQRTMHRI